MAGLIVWLCYIKTADGFQAALDGMVKEDVNARWQAFMASYFENLGGQHPDERMVHIEELFHLD